VVPFDEFDAYLVALKASSAVWRVLLCVIGGTAGVLLGRGVSLTVTALLGAFALLAAGLDGLKNKREPGKRLDIDMYAEGHTVKDAKKLPLNLLDALREFDKDKSLKASLGDEFSAAYLKLKHQEWNSYAQHFTQWERDHTLDV
jgi:glutamine synthetase